MTETPLVQSRSKGHGKTGGKRRSTALYNIDQGGWQRQKRSAIKKKSEIIILLFSARVSEYPISSVFTVLWPGRSKVSKLGKGGIVSVLLLVTGQSVIFVTEGCRRNLSGASGQTALWFDNSDSCPVFVPSFSGQTERSAVRNWFTSYSLPPIFFPGRNRKDIKKRYCSNWDNISSRWL